MHPVQLDVDYVERRSRLTTFFRWILVIPHVIFLAIYGIVAGIVVFIAWFAILITGSFPAGMWNLVAGFNRYYARVTGYMYLVTDPFPPFSGDGEYPATLHIERPERQSRWKTLIRIILAIPFYIVAYLLNIAMGAVGFLLWLIIVITGKSPLGLHNFQEMCVRYSMRFYAFLYLLVDAWPSFEEPAAEPRSPESRSPEPAV
jgi:Domain of unknown function (DUF4389)